MPSSTLRQARTTGPHSPARHLTRWLGACGISAFAFSLVTPQPVQPQAGSGDDVRWEREALELRRHPATEAHQAVAVDRDHFYAIDNRTIGKYEKATGRRVAGWEGPAGGPIEHLNSGIVVDGRLYAAHSNYPAVPMTGSIEVWDVATMQHVDSHSFGIYQGSATWIDLRDESWWVAFVHYDGSGGEPGRDVSYSSLLRFDREWRRTGGWVFPGELVERFRPYSSSGGTWGEDGLLYLTGHDAAELYVARLPSAGSTLEWLGTVSGVHQGQGIAWDRTDPGILFSIHRGTREVIVSRVPPAPDRPH